MMAMMAKTSDATTIEGGDFNYDRTQQPQPFVRKLGTLVGQTDQKRQSPQKAQESSTSAGAVNECQPPKIMVTAEEVSGDSSDEEHY